MEEIKRLKVCLTLEGSYPFITGGVSAWIHDLILGLPKIDFILFTISPKENQSLRYTLPKNVVEHIDIVISSKINHQVKIGKKKEKDILKMLIKGYKEHENISQYIVDIINNTPEGYSVFNNFINSDEGWDLIVKDSIKRNPAYSFSDYFWAWKSSYDLLFNIISQKMPKADIYHAVSTGFAGVAALCGKLRNKKPMLLSEHGLYHKEREMEIRRATFVKGYQRDIWIEMYYNLSRACYSNSDIITSLFELNRQYQIQLGADPLNCYVTPNGIDIEKFKVKRVPKSGFHIGLVGRVVPIKDIKTFIKMSKILSQRIPEVHFYCIGPTDEDPYYFSECKNLVYSLGLDDFFTFTGRVNVLDYYCFLNVMLLTSIREAQPLVILEGWLANIPVVSTKVGNVPEMLDYDERFLASSKDFQKLADSVLYIYNNPERIDEINNKNRLKVENFYNKEKLHAKYMDIYKKLEHIKWQE